MVKILNQILKKVVKWLSGQVVKWLYSFLLITYSLIHLSTCIYGAFDELNIGARPQGMAGAFTAIADDTNALFYNPAGISQLKKSEFTSNYGRLFLGLDDNSAIGSSFVGYAHPLEKYGTPGISWYNLALSNLYDETAISVSYSYPFTKDFLAGVSVKNLSRKFGSDLYTETARNDITDETRSENGKTNDPVFDNGKKSTVYSGDLGLMYLYSKNVSIGFSARNCTTPDIGLTDSDKISAVYRLGCAYKGGRRNDYLLSVEAVNKNSDINFLTGGEKWFSAKTIALRGGLTIGSRRWTTISLGTTLRLENLSVDYAFLWPLSGIKDVLGTHKIALTIKLGRPKLTKEEQAFLEERVEKIKAEETAKKALLEKEKFQKEAERIKLDTAKKIEEAKRAEAEAKRQRQMLALQEAEMERMRQKAELEKAFKDSMLDYQKRVSAGAEVSERLLLLDKLIKKYDNKGIDISDATKEQDAVMELQRTAKTDYTASITYYRRLKARGATPAQRQTLLLRIVEKYKGKGIDISEAERELETIK
ncbi:MAG: type IX secretion system membrane protein PorP/SprF [Elusimicrobiota bacterium]